MICIRNITKVVMFAFLDSVFGLCGTSARLPGRKLSFLWTCIYYLYKESFDDWKFEGAKDYIPCQVLLPWLNLDAFSTFPLLSLLKFTSKTSHYIVRYLVVYIIRFFH